MLRHFLGDALDAGAAGDQRVHLAAFGAGVGHRHLVAAMVAGEPPAQAMLDHPGGAIGALDARAAGAAEGERCIAAAVEEQQCLFPLGQRRGDGGVERRAEPRSPLRREAAHVDGGDIGQLRAAETRRQRQMAIGALGRLHLGFDRRGGGGEDDARPLLPRPHHRDVAGVVMDALLLLEAGFMRFIDDGDAQVLERQEQRRARPDDDLGPPIGDGGKGGAALAGLEVGVPRHRLGAEARREAREPGGGQRDFGEEDERLPARSQRRRDGFEIDFGLARAGDAFEQPRHEAARP